MRRHLAAVAFVAALPMCSSSGADRNAPPASTVPGESAIVGPKGGTVISESGARLVVPEGALDQDVTIAIAASPTATAPSGYVAHSPIYVFSPDGLVFKKPVTVELPLPAIATADDRIIWSSKLRGIEVLTTTIVDPMITTQVTHFSEGFFGQALPPAHRRTVARRTEGRRPRVRTARGTPTRTRARRASRGRRARRVPMRRAHRAGRPIEGVPPARTGRSARRRTPRAARPGLPALRARS